MRSRRRWYLMGAIALGAVVVLGLLWAWRGRPIRAQVVDARTGQPIPGAVVLGVWTTREGLPGLAHAALVGVRELETDAEGRFTLERPRRRDIEEEAVTVYKFGYVAWSNLFIFPDSESRKDTRVPARILLKPFPPGARDRRHYDFINDASRSVIYSMDDAPRFFWATRREIEGGTGE